MFLLRLSFTLVKFQLHRRWPLSQKVFFVFFFLRNHSHKVPVKMNHTHIHIQKKFPNGSLHEVRNLNKPDLGARVPHLAPT
jgi:hypothetical protein